MRTLMMSLLLAVAGVVGMAAASPAEARNHGRIYVDIGDVTFAYGRPYWRHGHEPLHVVYERGYPRYYRMPAPVYYAPPPPRYVYAPPRAYVPRPVYAYPRYDRHPPRYYRDHGRRDHHHHRGRGW